MAAATIFCPTPLALALEELWQAKAHEVTLGIVAVDLAFAIEIRAVEARAVRVSAFVRDVTRLARARPPALTASFSSAAEMVRAPT